MKKLTVMFIGLLLVVPCQADIISVDANGMGDYPTIQEQIDDLNSYIEDIEIVPQNPSSSDTVDITVLGWWYNSCVPNSSDASVSGNNVYFDVIRDYPPDVYCYDAVSGWGRIESVGPLSAGTYRVYARLCELPMCLPSEE